MQFKIIKLIVLLMTCDLISCQGYFTIVGSKLMRHQTTYRVSVASQGYNSSQVLEVAVRTSDKTAKVFQVAKQVKLVNGKTQNVVLDLQDQPIGDYNLEAKIVEGQAFEKFVRLNLNTKKNSVLIQTDKAMYKPADKVQFRVIVLDPELRPLQDAQVVVFITDSAQNRVKQFEDVYLTKGVFQGEFQLSELAALGIWYINVKLNGGKDIKKDIEVAKYTLPTFEMKIQSVANTNYNEGKVYAKVLAKYTFGKIAKGSATVTAEIGSQYSFDDYGGGFRGGRRPWPIYIEPVKVSKTVEVDGKKSVEFDMFSELKITDKTRDATVRLFAVFKEELTGREQNATASVVIRPYAYQLDLIKSANQFKPGLPYEIKAVVKYWEKDEPITDSKNPVEVSVKYYYDVMRTCERYVYKSQPWQPYQQVKIAPSNVTTTSTTTTKTPTEFYPCRDELSYQLDTKAFASNGIADIDIVLPSNTTRIDVTAKYLGITKMLNYIQRLPSESNQYIQIKSLSDKPTLSKNIRIDVRSTVALASVNYRVLGNGNVILSKEVKASKKKNFQFAFKPTLAMLPRVKLIVSYITASGEIISDTLKIEFGNELVNKIDVTLSENQAKPGDTVTITVNTAPESYVGLLGIDQSVKILKSGNDIEKSTVFNELDQYNQPTNYNYGYSPDPRYDTRYYQDFQTSESVVITNAKNPYQEKYIPLYTPLTSTRYPYYYSEDGMVMEMEMMMPQARENQRAPQAMPGQVGDQASEQEVTVRREFPETFIFDSFNFDYETSSVQLVKKVPDTITSWLITGFSVDPVTGLGLTQQSTNLVVFRPFFVSANLPYSIKRGEVVTIPVIVYNYLDYDYEATVTFYNADKEFEFVGEANSGEKPNDDERTKKVLVKSQSGVTVPFMIRPLKVGQITIKVIGKTSVAGDGIEKPLIVEPEGVTQYMNKAILIDLRKSSEFFSKISISIPPNAVPESTKVEASAIGDILGPSLENLDNLIRLPGGCGEQNMIGFVPNIVAIEYLTTVKKLTPENEAKAKTNMEKGYQGQLAYKRIDGSYSAFGMRDGAGSTWLSAYVAKFFYQASKFISIDTRNIDEILVFLSNVQAPDGSFPEKGQVIHKDMQGGSSSGLALTAYTLITFLENQAARPKYETTIKKALDYIVKNIESIQDNYSLAITAYALQLANHSLKESILKKLDGKSKNVNGLKYWEKVIVASEQNNPWMYRPNTVNVEMSAYGLQALLLAELDGDAVSVMKWLITQRNAQGGFSSTQDTVVGLQALSKLAAKIYSAGNEIEIYVDENSGSQTYIHINEDNAMVLQKFELPSEARDFDIAAYGSGMTILQISYRYNIDNSGEFPRFLVAPKLTNKTTKNFIYLEVCTSFVADTFADKSNMAVMEVTFPSGFVFDSESISELRATEKVKKIETKCADTQVILYFDDISAKKICPIFKAYRVHNVALQKPSPVVVYDYYDNSRVARSFYNAPDISVCDICNGAVECIKRCSLNVSII